MKKSPGDLVTVGLESPGYLFKSPGNLKDNSVITSVFEDREIGLVVAVWNQRDTLAKRDEILVLTRNGGLGWAYDDHFYAVGEL